MTNKEIDDTGAVEVRSLNPHQPIDDIDNEGNAEISENADYPPTF